MLALVPLLGRLVKRVGMKRSIIVSSFPAALGFLGLYFAQGFWQVMLAYWVVILASQVGNLSQRPMLGAIIDQDEQQTNIRKAGLFTGLNALITIPVSGIQAAIFTSLIGRYGFASGSAAQSARAIEGIRIGAGVIPFFFVLLGILPMLLSPISTAREKELSAFSEQRHRLLGEPDGT